MSQAMSQRLRYVHNTLAGTHYLPIGVFANNDLLQRSHTSNCCCALFQCLRFSREHEIEEEQRLLNAQELHILHWSTESRPPVKVFTRFGGDGAEEEEPSFPKLERVIDLTAWDPVSEDSQSWYPVHPYSPPLSSSPPPTNFPSLPIFSLSNSTSSSSNPSTPSTLVPNSRSCSPYPNPALSRLWCLPHCGRLLNMAWPCHGGEDVPDMQDLTLLQRSSIYDLLKDAQIPFIATVDVVKPSPFGVVLVSNVSDFLPGAQLLLSGRFCLLTIIPRSRTVSPVRRLPTS